MSDSVEEGQRCFDARRLRYDAIENGGYRSILFRKNRAQIQQHAAFVNSRNDWRL